MASIQQKNSSLQHEKPINHCKLETSSIITPFIESNLYGSGELFLFEARLLWRGEEKLSSQKTYHLPSIQPHLGIDPFLTRLFNQHCTKIWREMKAQTHKLKLTLRADYTNSRAYIIWKLI